MCSPRGTGYQEIRVYNAAIVLAWLDFFFTRAPNFRGVQVSPTSREAVDKACIRGGLRRMLPNPQGPDSALTAGFGCPPTRAAIFYFVVPRPRPSRSGAAVVQTPERHAVAGKTNTGFRRKPDDTSGQV